MPELTIERDVDLPLEKAFAAWTDPALLSRWFAPGDKMTCRAEADVQVGGRYRIAMHDPDTGDDHIVSGTYLAVAVNERLTFDWCWLNSEFTTQVDVHFHQLDAARTRITLHHKDFPNQQMCDKHSTGWNGCLSSLLARTELLSDPVAS